MAKQLTGQLTKDESSAPIQIGRNFVTTNGTQTSPLSYTTGVTTLLIPSNAIEVHFYPTSDLKVSELVAVSTYDLIVTGSKEAVCCAGMSQIYLAGSTASGTLYFKFVTI